MTTDESENVHALDKTLTGLASDFRYFRLENSQQHAELHAAMDQRFDAMEVLIRSLRNDGGTA